MQLEQVSRQLDKHHDGVDWEYVELMEISIKSLFFCSHSAREKNTRVVACMSLRRCRLCAQRLRLSKRYEFTELYNATPFGDSETKDMNKKTQDLQLVSRRASTDNHFSFHQHQRRQLCVFQNPVRMPQCIRPGEKRLPYDVWDLRGVSSSIEGPQCTTLTWRSRVVRRWLIPARRPRTSISVGKVVVMWWEYENSRHGFVMSATPRREMMEMIILTKFVQKRCNLHDVILNILDELAVLPILRWDAREGKG